MSFPYWALFGFLVCLTLLAFFGFLTLLWG